MADHMFVYVCAGCGAQMTHAAPFRHDCASMEAKSIEVVPAAHAERYEEALAYLADSENWAGDPTEHAATLYGHETPYELARRALGHDASREEDANS